MIGLITNQGSELLDSLKPDWRLLKPSLPSQLRGTWRQTWRTDTLAAATVAMVSIPQAVGFALIAGLPPPMVFTCVIVGGFVAALFFSSRHVVFGPSNSLSMLLAATFIAHGNSSLGPAELAVVLALLIGLFQLAAGCLHLGRVTQFISRSVVIGYGSAIGCLLAISQLHNLLGLSRPRDLSAWFVPWEALCQVVAGQIHPWPLALALAAGLSFYLIKRLRPNWPETLIVLLAFSTFALAVDLNALGIKTIGAGGAFFSTLPNFSGLPVTLSELRTMRDLLGPALAIALLGMLEAVSIAKTYGMKSGDRLDINRDLVAMGLGNLACAGCSAMPGSASFARSAANYQAGARTQFSGMLSSLFVLGLAVILAPLISHLPVPALAAALVRIGWHIVDLDQVRIAARATRSDALVLFGTFFIALLLPLDTAIFCGVGLSIALALRKASAPSLTEYAFNAGEQLTEIADPKSRVHPQIAIIHVEGELFFGAADLFQDHVRHRAEAENLKIIILRLKNARHLDATTAFAIRGLHDWMRQNGRHLLISGVHGGVLQVLQRTGLLALLGEAQIFPAELNPNIATRKALKHAQHLLGTSDAEVRIFYDKPERAGMTVT